jgi:hypothetical protein
MVSPQAPNRKPIEKQNCPCATAVVQIISDHSTQHALLSHGQFAAGKTTHVLAA